jgi:hypothetical protein
VAPVLYLRTPGGRIFPPITDEAAREAAAQSSADEARLNEAWHGLLAAGPAAARGRGRRERPRAPLKLLSRSELEALAARKRDLGLQPLQALLLLVSAVVADTEEEPWLQELGTAEGKGLIRRLDSTEPSLAHPPEEVQQLLGLQPPDEGEQRAGVGPVARSAVRHLDPVTRQSAALALSVLDPSPREGLDRLERSLRTVDRAPARWARRSELWGTLADAVLKVEELTQKLSPPRRLGIWGWRVWRRIARESEWLIARVICSALGAGLALGVWRGLITLLAGEPWPLFFFIHSYLGGLFGFFAVLGMSLAGPTFLHRRGEAPSPGRLGRRATAIGALFFAITNVVLAAFTLWDPSERPWQPLTGALFGLGLCLALYGLPKLKGRPGVAGVLARLAVAAVAAALAQVLILLLAGERPYEALVIGLSSSERGRFYGHWFESGLDRYSGLDLLVMVFDTGATGAVLALGALIGLTNARKVLNWWHRAAGAVEPTPPNGHS